MEWSLLAQGGLNGLMLGTNYALIALGLTLIFGILGIVNFTHGEMYMLGGYSAYYLFGHFHLNFFLTLALSALLVGVLGAFLEKFIFRPLTTRPKLELTSLIAAVGLAWVFQMLAVIAFGDLDKNVPSAFRGIIRTAGIVITVERLATILLGIGLVVLLNIFLLKTKTGMTIRAVAQDKEAAALQGVPVDRVTAMTFGLGCGLAAISGALVAPIFGVSPTMGGEVILKAFLVVILGGMGSVPGAMLGGLVLGFIESFGCLFFSVPTVMVLTFSIIIMILILKPKGLLGHA